MTMTQNRFLHAFILPVLLIAFALAAPAQQPAPLKQIGAMQFPAQVTGHFDHITVDLKGHRLFSTPEDYKSVVVFDLNPEREGTCLARL